MVSFRDHGRSPLCYPRPSSPAWTPGLFEFVKTSFQNRHLHNRRVNAGQLIRPQPWPPTTSSTGARSKRKNLSKRKNISKRGKNLSKRKNLSERNNLSERKNLVRRLSWPNVSRFPCCVLSYFSLVFVVEHSRWSNRLPCCVFRFV